MINESKLTELCIRVMREPIPWRPKSDAVYLVAQTRDNENSVLDVCASYLDREDYVYVGPPRILISNNVDATEEISGYPGACDWREKLKAFEYGMKDYKGGYGAPEILSFDVHGPANTLTELTGMVKYARENNWGKITLVASPFHQLRAFITVVSVLLKEHPELKVYNQVGCPLDWNEPMKHSQNEPSAKRSDVIAKEIRRIYAYHEKGDLVDVETVLAYLDWRDSA